jgi:hypothetical protein
LEGRIFIRYSFRDRYPELPLVISSCHHRTTWSKPMAPYQNDPNAACASSLQPLLQGVATAI